MTNQIKNIKENHNLENTKKLDFFRTITQMN